MKLSDKEKIEMVEKYIEGKSSIQLAKEYNITKQSVLSILKVRKVVIRSGK